MITLFHVTGGYAMSIHRAWRPDMTTSSRSLTRPALTNARRKWVWKTGNFYPIILI